MTVQQGRGGFEDGPKFLHVQEHRLECLGGQRILSLLSSLFERRQVGSIQKPAVDGSTPGCWMQSFIAKTLLSLWQAPGSPP